MTRWMSIELIISCACILIGIGYFIAEMINLLLPSKFHPLNVQLAISSSEYSTVSTDETNSSIPEWLPVLISIILWCVYLLEGIMGLYMK